MNIYQMYHANNCKFGFYVIRDSWATVIAQITNIEGINEGNEIKGNGPYYNNPKVKAKFYKVIDNEIGLGAELCANGHFIEENYLSCPGTYAYTLVQ